MILSWRSRSPFTCSELVVNKTSRFAAVFQPHFAWALLAVWASAPGTMAVPQIALAPANVSVIAGQNATFTVAATGSGTVLYQWRRNGFPLTGATASTFVIAGTTRAAADIYDVVVTDATGATTSQPVHLSVAPTVYPSTLAPDPAWSLELEVSSDFGDIRAIAPTRDGGFVATGQFSSVNGVRRTSLMRVKANGTLDGAFVPVDISGSDVRSVAVQSDGKVLVSGYFGVAGDQPKSRIARLNTDGSLDPSFKPDIGNVFNVGTMVVQPDGKIIVSSGIGASRLHRFHPDGSTDLLFAGVVGTINAVALQPDGRIMAAGIFSATEGGVTRTQVVRYNFDGTLDTAFDAGSGSNAVPLTVAIQTDGRIVVGGTFTEFNGKAVSGFVRLTNSGAVDDGFGGPMAAGVTPSINALVALPDGKILIGGSTIFVGELYYAGYVRLDVSGALDVAPVAPPSNVQSLAIQSDGKIVAGGNFFSVAGVARARLARYWPSGVLDDSVNFTFLREGFPASVVPVADGQYVVTGGFDFVGGQPYQGLVRLNADATIDTSFRPGGGSNAGGAAGFVQAAAVLPDGRIAITGSFGTFGGKVRRNIAVINRDGTLDTSFAPPAGLNDPGIAIAVLPASRLVVASRFQGANGARGLITVFKLDGSLDNSFASGTGFEGDVRVITVQPDGKILVGGSFSSYNGRTASNLARLNPDGSFDAGFKLGSGPDGTVNCIRVLPDGKLVVAGRFDRFDGVNQGSVVRLNKHGTRDPSFMAIDIKGVASAVVQEDGKIIVVTGSTSSLVDGRGIVRLNPDGTLDPSFRSSGIAAPTYSSVGSLVMRDDGQLILCDNLRFLATRPASAPVLTAQPAKQTVVVGGTATLSVAANSVLPMTYQWLFNGNSIAGATSATHVISGFQAAHAGAYAVRVNNDLGSVTSLPASVTTPLTTRGRISNISIRSAAGTGDNTLIVGIGLGGSGTGGGKEVLIRGVGETLSSTFGLGGALPDPRIELYNSARFKIDENDDWAGVFNFASVGAFPFARAATKDAAIYNPVAAAGSFSIHVMGKNSATGVALAEIYDATPADRFTTTTPRLINVSARTQAGTGDDVLIAGFVVSGDAGVRVLIRGVAETLAHSPFSISGVLPDPTLELYDEAKVKIMENDNWSTPGGNPELSASFASVGAFPLTSNADSALVATLLPGAYTVMVRSALNSTGLALVEIYELP